MEGALKVSSVERLACRWACVGGMSCASPSVCVRVCGMSCASPSVCVCWCVCGWHVVRKPECLCVRHVAHKPMCLSTYYLILGVFRVLLSRFGCVPGITIVFWVCSAYYYRVLGVFRVLLSCFGCIPSPIMVFWMFSEPDFGV